MAFAYGKLAEITTLPNSAGAVLTNAASTTTYIRGIMLHNGNTTAETVILYKVPDSTGSVGTAGTTNEIYKEIMAPGATTFLEYPVPGLIMTDENDTIQGVTTTASKCTIQFTGATE